MKKLTKVLKALSDQNRLRIIKLLQLKTMCVCELKFSLGLAQSSISKHLKILEEADLVEYRKEGLWVNYSLSGSPDNPYAAEMLEKLNKWLKQDKEFEDILKKAAVADRQIITRR